MTCARVVHGVCPVPWKGIGLASRGWKALPWRILLALGGYLQSAPMQPVSMQESNLDGRVKSAAIAQLSVTRAVGLRSLPCGGGTVEIAAGPSEEGSGGFERGKTGKRWRGPHDTKPPR